MSRPMGPWPPFVAVIGALATTCALLTGASAPSASAASAVLAQAQVRALPVDTRFDYQLGGVRAVPRRVGIVERDRTAAPLKGRYNICYVNGFQTQVNEEGFWRTRMRLVLHRAGKPVEDAAWGEWLLDIRTAAKRARLAAIVDRWTRGCARDGFDAVEYDNLDSYTRSQRMISRREAVRFARLLVRGAHEAGLAAGQKNLSDFDGRTLGYDFAIAEECGRYHECGAYVRHYGRRVLMVEYRRRDLRFDCRRFGQRMPIVLRDRDLTTHGVRRWC